MIVSKNEPYEQNLRTLVKWNMSKNKISTLFFRGKIKELILWNEMNDIYADKLCLLDASKKWKADIQAMTDKKFHLQVNSNLEKNIILYSGTVEKLTPLHYFFRNLF